MMATTHALAGVVLAAVAFTVAPDAGAVPVFAAAFGGLFPDFDLYSGHRKTLHFPVYYTAAALPALALAAVVPTTATLAVALFLAAAALHSVMDVAGGGLELRPWQGTSDRAVYSHYHNRWLPPKRWVRYDGAPEDLLVAGALAVPVVLTFDGAVETLAFVALGVSTAYVVLRKPLVTLGERLVAALPETTLERIPDCFIDDFR